MPTSTAPDLGWTVLLDGSTAAGPLDIGRLGGKGAQTARLMGLGLPVPRCGVVAVDAYRRVAADPRVSSLLGQIRSGDVVEADVVDAAFAGAALPADVEAAIVALGEDVACGGTVAVRSSATVEDLAGTSFAGQYRSLLAVRPGDDLVAAVRLVWASLWHPAPCAYRRVNGVPEADVAMAVLVMEMVPAVRAGVTFTVDPGGRADHLRVEAVDGLGEALVSGAVTPSSWVLPRGGPPEPGPIGAAARLALDAERGFGVPLDVEWAWDGETTWLVQARPITGLVAGDGFDTAVDDHALTTAGIAEMLPGVLPPLVWQLAGTAVEEALRAAFDSLGAVDGTQVEPHAVIRRVRGRAALDLDALRSVARAVPGGSPAGVEHGFFGTGDPAPVGAAAPRWRQVRHDLRVDAARRRAEADCEVVVGAVAHLTAEVTPLRDLDRAALLARRRRLVDLGFRAMAAEVAVAASAAAAYEHLTAFLGSHLPPDEAASWARRATTGVSRGTVRPTASMSVFAGPTWEEEGVVPPPPPPTDGRADEARRDLEERLRRLPRWRATRIMTGQIVDVRLHLVRRLVAEALTLLGWRERTKAAVLEVGGLVRATHVELGRRLVAEGRLEGPADVDLLSDAELRGADPLPGAAALGRRRRALGAMAAAGSLPEQFTGVPARTSAPMPEGDRLPGLAASGGRFTGRARAIRDPRSGRLRRGEVLVAESTDAGWSPLFVEAGAIVVERGGPLSHAAIVARELGVPAVLAAEGAMTALDGRLVTVDGDAGLVIVHDGDDQGTERRKP